MEPNMDPNPDEDSYSELELEELTEFDVDPVEELDAALLSLNSQITSRRGRPRIPEKWTRIISLRT